MSGEWYPGATKKPFSEAFSQALMRPTQVIHHVTSSTGPISGTWNYFQTGTNIESHYGIDYGAAYGGIDYAWQGIPNNRKADANYHANLRPDGTGALSVETRGGEFGEWTPWQIDWLVAHGVWCHRQFGIPLRICRTPADPGFGYHTLFGAPSAWTPVAKTCPGPNRIKQWRNVVFPRIEALDVGDDMPTAEEVAAAVWGFKIPDVVKGGTLSASAVLAWLGNDEPNIKALVTTMPDKVADAVVAKLPPSGDYTLEQVKDAVKAALREGVGS